MGGKLRLGNKADLLKCLGSAVLNFTLCGCQLLDGAAIILMLSPGTAQLNQEYSSLHNYIISPINLLVCMYYSKEQPGRREVDTTYYCMQKMLPREVTVNCIYILMQLTNG